MKKQNPAQMEFPTVEQLEAELKREKRSRRSRFWIRGLLLIIVLAVLIGIVISFVWMPVLRISGDSMSPTLTDGEIVVAYADEAVERGDIIAFYYNNKLLVKRVIAVGGDEINIDLLGNVTVNGERLEENYVSNRARGECDVDMPYRVPNGFVFVMGDRRSDSLDSRSSAIGCVAKEQILGRVVAQIWPKEEIRWIGRKPIFE